MIDSVHPSEKMKNQVTLGANIKYVLIKLREGVENEAAFRSFLSISWQTFGQDIPEGVREGLIFTLRPGNFLMDFPSIDCHL